MGKTCHLEPKVAEMLVRDIRELTVSAFICRARQIASSNACETHDVNKNRCRRGGEAPPLKLGC
jgi:hypothetical protein